MSRSLFATRAGRVRAGVPVLPTAAADQPSAWESGPRPATPLPAGVDMGGVLERVRQQLIARVPAEQLRAYRSDPRIRERLERLVRDLVAAEAGVLGRQASTVVAEQVLQDLLGYGPIQPLIDAADVSEIMVNGPEQIWAERGGRLAPQAVRFRDAEHLRQVVERIVAGVGRRIDESLPLADARLPDGSRVNAVLPPVGLDGPYLTIRKFGRRLTPTELVERGAVTQQIMAFLAACVRARFNVVVSGGTGTGKTTFLNCLSSFIPEGERIVTIEDAAELQLQQPHVVRMETRTANVEGKGEVTIRQLVKNALRMRPDRIVVGECRGGEALDMLQAMNTGHDGSLTTLHANSPRDAIRRLEVMVLMAGEELPLRAIREQIASAVDVIVQIARLRDGSRRLIAVSQVLDLDDGGSVAVQDLLRFRHLGESEGRIDGQMEATGTRLAPALQERLAEHGQLDAAYPLEGGGG